MFRSGPWQKGRTLHGLIRLIPGPCPVCAIHDDGSTKSEFHYVVIFDLIRFATCYLSRPIRSKRNGTTPQISTIMPKHLITSGRKVTRCQNCYAIPAKCILNFVVYRAKPHSAFYGPRNRKAYCLGNSSTTDAISNYRLPI